MTLTRKPQTYHMEFDTKSINPLEANVPFLYPLKTSENQRFSDVFRGYRNVAYNGLYFGTDS